MLELGKKIKIVDENKDKRFMGEIVGEERGSYIIQAECGCELRISVDRLTEKYRKHEPIIHNH